MTPPFEKVRPCDIHKLVNSLKLRKACGLDGIPNEGLRHLPRRPPVYLIYFFHHCLQLSHFPKPSKEPGKDPKLPQNLCPISILSTTDKLFKKVIMKIVQRYIEENGLINASQSGFHACHSIPFQCMRLMNHMTLNFNNSISTAVVFLGKKTFGAT
jgi:hypothetical protein